MAKTICYDCHKHFHQVHFHSTPTCSDSAIHSVFIPPFRLHSDIPVSRSFLISPSLYSARLIIYPSPYCFRSPLLGTLLHVLSRPLLCYGFTWPSPSPYYSYYKPFPTSSPKSIPTLRRLSRPPAVIPTLRNFRRRERNT